MIITQQDVNEIVARAKSSALGLSDPEPGKSYSLANYEPNNLTTLAMIIVGAHFEKWEIISIVAAALEHVAIKASKP